MHEHDIMFIFMHVFSFLSLNYNTIVLFIVHKKYHSVYKHLLGKLAELYHQVD